RRRPSPHCGGAPRPRTALRHRRPDRLTPSAALGHRAALNIELAGGVNPTFPTTRPSFCAGKRTLSIAADRSTLRRSSAPPSLGHAPTTRPLACVLRGAIGSAASLARFRVFAPQERASGSLAQSPSARAR